MEEKCIKYLKSLSEDLRKDGREKTAEKIDEVCAHFERSFWHQMSCVFLDAIHDPFLLQRGIEIHDNFIIRVRASISPIAYVKTLYFICFGDLSALTPESASPYLKLLDGACASLVANGSEQGSRAALCIRTLLLLELESSSNRGSGKNDINEAEEASPVSPASGDSFENTGVQVGAATSQSVRRILNEMEDYVVQHQMHEVEPVFLLLLAKARGKDLHLRRLYTKLYFNAFEIVDNASRAEMPLLKTDMEQLAIETAFAALLSDTIFNFGKLLNSETFTKCLPEWLLKWLELANKGDVLGFEQFAKDHEQDIIAELMKQRSQDKQTASIQEELRQSLIASLMKKVRLMALLHLVFHTPLNERSLPFHVIAERCCVNVDTEVEPLLLSALAKGIAKGKLDGLHDIAHITWVLPRVLSREEIREFAQNIGKWRETVAGVSEYVTKITADEMGK